MVDGGEEAMMSEIYSRGPIGCGTFLVDFPHVPKAFALLLAFMVTVLGSCSNAAIDTYVVPSCPQSSVPSVVGAYFVLQVAGCPSVFHV